MNKIIGIIVVFVIATIIILAGCIGYNETQNFQVIQKMSGTMSVQSTGGYYNKFFPQVWEYDKVRTIYFSDVEDEGEEDRGLPVRFENKGTGNVSVQVIVRLFSDPETILKMHEYSRGDVAVIESIILAKLKEIAMTEASKISSNEAIENYSNFNEAMRTNILNNSELANKGIFIEQFSVTSINFDQNTITQFSKQQEIELARKESEANKIKYETELVTVKIQYEKEQAEAQGKAEVEMIKQTTDAERDKKLAEIAAAKEVEVAKLEADKAKVDADKLKEVAIIEATRNKETAALNNEASKLDAERVITLAQAKQKELELAKGLSEFDKYKMDIDKETSIQVASKVAEAIRGLNLPSTVIMGSGGVDKQSNPLTDLLQLLVVKEAKTIK